MAIPAHLNDHPVFNGSPWGAMSGEAPRFHAEEQPTHENLVNHLRQRGVKFEETHGRYGDPERSVLIYKPTRELMSELGKKFGQESVVYSNGGKHELLYTNGEHEGKSRLTSPGNEPITWHDEAPDDYYSHLPNHGYFTINFDFDRDPEFQGPAPVCPECRTATKGDFCHQCGARQWSGPAPVQKSEAFARSPIMRLKKAWPRDEKENQANAASHAVMEDAILEQGGTKQKHPLRWEAVDPMARANVSPSAAGSSWGTPEAQAGQGWNRCRSCGTDFEMNDPHHTLCPDCDTHFDEEGVTPELVPYFTAQEPAVPWDREFAEGDKVAQAAEQSYWSNVGASTDREARFATAFPALSSSSWQNANQIPTKAEMQSAYERSPIFNKKLKKANPPHELNQVLADQLQEQGFKPAEVPNSVGIRGTQSYRGREANRSWSPDWREAIAQRTEQQFNRLTRPNEGTAHLTVDPEDAGYFAERQAIYDIGAAHLSRDKDDPNFGGKDAHFHNMPGVRDADDLGPELNREVGLPHPHAYEWHDGHTDHHVTAPNPTLVKGVSNPQKLDKMAIADLRPSEHPAKNEQGQNVFNYSHLLSPDQQNAGYRMHLVHEKRSGTHELTAEIYHNHGFVGDLSGYSMMPMRHGEVPELDVVTADIPGTDHHNKGLGRALYEALYAHAYHHLGARRVNGDRHSSMAHRVHVSLAKKHGLEYVGRERATTRPRGPFDGRFGSYSYALKSEQDLDKMAIADLKPASKHITTAEGHKQYDYTHLLTPEHRAEGYRMHLVQTGARELTSEIWQNGNFVGDLSSVAFAPRYIGGAGEMHMQCSHIPDKVHHNKGLGKALYEAQYTHAYHNLGVRTVHGDRHSSMAQRVHESLARKHGLDYVATPRVTQYQRPEGPFDGRFSDYSYALKSELQKGWPKDETENQANAASHAVMEDAILEQGGKKTVHRGRGVAALRDRALKIVNTCRHPDHGMSPCEPDSGHGHPFVPYRPPGGYPDSWPWNPQPMPKTIAAEHWQEVDKESSGLAKNAQVAPAGVPTYSQFAGAYGAIQPGQSNLMHYPYHGKSSEVADLVKRHGYRTYFAGGKYGKPDLQAKNYNTGHLMIYDPTPQSGGDFHDHQYTSAWRQMHELAHALTLKDVNDLYGEGRRMGKLGTHRSSNEALRAVHWEWLAAHKQRELNTQIGIHVPDETFHKELNTVMHDAVHRAVTGKFTEPSSEGFAPHSYKVPLHIALDTVRQHAEGMGLKNPHAKLQKAVPSEPPLSLELVCGQTGVDPEHPGYWEGPGGESLYHPKHQEVHDRLKAHGIRVDLSSHEDDGMYFSDAYVKFHPHQIGHVVDALRASRHPGDILDFKARLAPKHDQAVRAVARREGWSVGNDIQKGWPKDEKENQANAASHAVMEDAWLEQGAKKKVHRGFVQDLRDRASWSSYTRTNAVRDLNDELRHQNVPAGVVPAMPANYSFAGTGYDHESFGTINEWNANYSNPYPRTNDQKYWQNVDKESTEAAKGNVNKADPNPNLHSHAESFLNALKGIPRGTPDRGRFITQHMSHPPFIAALKAHPQGVQIHKMLMGFLNSTANAGPGVPTKVMAKARPPQEVNQVLADQLQEQGFKPTKGYTTKQGLGTRLNAVKINHPPELPARGVGETLAPWERRRVDQIGRGAPGEIAEILDQRYAPYDDSSGELQWATRDPGRLEPAQWDAPQFNPKALTAKVYDKQYWQQVSEGYPKNLGPDPEPAATAAQIPAKAEMQTAWQRSPLFKRKGQ